SAHTLQRTAFLHLELVSVMAAMPVGGVVVDGGTGPAQDPIHDLLGSCLGLGFIGGGGSKWWSGHGVLYKRCIARIPRLVRDANGISLQARSGPRLTIRLVCRGSLLLRLARALQPAAFDPGVAARPGGDRGGRCRRLLRDRS